MREAIEEAIEAVQTLRRVGRERDQSLTPDQAFAYGLMEAGGRKMDSLGICRDLLEDGNFHILAAIVEALGKGNVVRTHENTFVVTTNLPKGWDWPPRGGR